jgi:hypothetical protein
VNDRVRQLTLPTLESTGFTLWYRPNGRRGTSWEPVAQCETRGECVRAIGIGGRRNGGWLIKPAGDRP